MRDRFIHATDPEAAVTGVTAEFERRFGGPADGVWAAPGRVNLIGEHTDYNAGLCLPIALPHRTYAAVRRRDDDRVRLVSQQDAATWDGSLDDVTPGALSGWAAYPAGVLWALRQNGLDVPGMDVVVDGGVPLGSGLSSSAALECSVGLAAWELLGRPDDSAGRRVLAEACVRAENEVAGAPTGGMDQSASLLATADHALLLDCREGATEQIPLPLEAWGLVVLVIDTQAPHRLVDGQYAQRRAACAEAAALLGVADLREVADRADGLDLVAGLPDDLLRRRARHVVTEIRRVADAAESLRHKRIEDFGSQLDSSHSSMRDDYEISSVELDVAVDAAREAGALGARMTGGGFGGSAIALVRQETVAEVAGAVLDAFCRNELADPRFLVATPSAAASRVSP